MPCPMNLTVKNDFLSRWRKYFPGAALPVALLYSDELNGIELAKKYAGHHCIIADFVKASRGKALAFNAENMG